MFPNQQLKETANAMVAAAQRGRSVVPVLKRLCPHVYRQIVRDARFPGLLSLWGRSVNVDANVGQTIVHPAILQGIGALAGVPMRGRGVHAGLQHTYGYLFSMLETPYGLKRDRWLSTQMEQGFGIDLTLLSDRPRAGTLFANLTWFLGQVVFRGRPRTLRRLARNAPAVAPALVDEDYTRYGRCRIVEQAVLRGTTNRDVVLITDLVPFPNPPLDGEADNTLLIYSVQVGTRSALKLITAFPVTPQVARHLQASARPRGSVAIRPQYNAYVPGWPNRRVLGRRHVASSAD
jgi:hypothetical protein